MTQSEIDNKKLKVSFCQKGHWVRSAADEYINNNLKARNEFQKEVFSYDLSVKTMTVKEFNDGEYEYCNCD
jgi:hypothetical protein